MKIVHVVPYIYPAMVYGGPAKLVYQLAKEQQNQGHTVTLLSSDSYNKTRRFSQAEKNVLIGTIPAIFAPNIVNSIAYTHRIFTHFGIIPAFFQLQKNDVFHLHDVFVLPQILFMYLLIIFKKKYIISPHGVLDPIRTRDKGIIKRVFFILLQPCFNQADTLIATSDKEQEDLTTLFPQHAQKIKTVWNGVQVPNVLAQKNPSEKIRLLYIGKLHPKKGLVQFIKALHNFPHYETIFDLTIAGPDDGEKENIDALIKKLNIQVHRLDFVNEEQKIKLYSNNDIFIHPSDSEGFSISIIEALSYRLPIFITKACNFKAADIKDCGFLIEDNSDSEIQKGLKEVIEKRNKLDRYGQKAYDLFVNKYTMNAMVKKLDSVMNNSFFGIKLSINSASHDFLDAFKLYFSPNFSNSYPILKQNQSVQINFNKTLPKVEKENDIRQLGQFVSVSEKTQTVEHHYLTTKTNIAYFFDQDSIQKINIHYQEGVLFWITNFLLGNILKTNLYKQIVKRYIQHPLLLDITVQNKLNCLHASAVEKNGEVIAFIGMNGVGKSSLVAQYITEKHYSLFTDNYLLADIKDTCYLYPSHIRLSDTKDNSNQITPVGNFGYGKGMASVTLSSEKKATLTKVYILQRGSQKSEEKITKQQAIEYIQNLQITDQEDIRYAITQLKINKKMNLQFSDAIDFYIKTIKDHV